LLTLPLAPVRGVVWIAGVVRDEAEGRYYSREAISVRLTQVERARDAGEISGQELAELQERILDDLRWDGR
jgi:hypothetical protein